MPIRQLVTSINSHDNPQLLKQSSTRLGTKLTCRYLLYLANSARTTLSCYIDGQLLASSGVDLGFFIGGAKDCWQPWLADKIFFPLKFPEILTNHINLRKNW